MIVSERHWAFAGRDGSLREGTMPSLPAWLHRVPLARGLARLGLSLAPLFRRSGVAGRREKPLLLAALIAPFLLFVLPGPWRTPVGIAATLALAVWMLRGRTLRLHGAEHRAIAAVEERRLVATWEGRARPTRFSPRCGTNFAALALPVTWLADRFWPLTPALWTPVAVTAVALAATMELWRFAQVRQLRVLLASRSGAPAPDHARADARRDAGRPPRRRVGARARSSLDDLLGPPQAAERPDGERRRTARARSRSRVPRRSARPR